MFEKVNNSVVQIKKVLEGTILLTREIQINAGFLLKGEVPLLWSDLWEGPEGP